MSEIILVVDDDKDIVNLLELYLHNNGYNVLKATNGKQAIEIIEKGNIDLVLLDVMMPEMDGIQTCLHIRKTKHIPIIFLTAKGSEGDIVHGLSAGADDYIVKPFSSVVLLAKVSSHLRRQKQYNSNPQNGTIQVSELIINPDTCKVSVAENEIKLTPKEFEILLLLATNKGRVYNIGQIHDLVWGDDDVITENSIMVHIANLRRKIEKDTRNPEYIKTIWGFGYKI